MFCTTVSYAVVLFFTGIFETWVLKIGVVWFHDVGIHHPSALIVGFDEGFYIVEYYVGRLVVVVYNTIFRRQTLFDFGDHFVKGESKDTFCTRKWIVWCFVHKGIKPLVQVEGRRQVDVVCQCTGSDTIFLEDFTEQDGFIWNPCCLGLRGVT